MRFSENEGFMTLTVFFACFVFISQLGGTIYHSRANSMLYL